MKKNLEEKISLQIISIGIAIILWFIISYTENPGIDVTLKNIPIKYINTDILAENDLVALYPDKTPTVSVVVRGKRAELFNILGRVTAEVDLATINTAGIYDMPININIPSSTVELVKKKDSAFNLNVEHMVSKNIPIKIIQTGDSGKYIVRSVADDDELEIAGAAAVTDSIESAVVYVDISSSVQDSDFDYTYILTDANGSKIESKNIFSPKERISVTNTVYLSKKVPLEIAYPKSVTEDCLIKINNSEYLYADIGVRKENFDMVESLTVNFPNSISDYTQTKLTLPINVPDSVYIPSGNFVDVSVSLTKKDIREMTIPLSFKNISGGLNISHDTPRQITVMLKGPADKLDLTYISAEADLSGLTAGEHNVAVKFNLPDEVKTDKDYNIHIMLN